MPSVVVVTVKSSGGDYTSLSAAEAGEQSNLVTDDVQLDIECYSMDDLDSRVVIDGWTMDATRYLRIYTPTSERHDGKWNTSKYRYRITTGWGGFFYGFDSTAEEYVRLEGLQISGENVTGSSRTVLGIGPGNVRLSDCIVKLVNSTGTSPGAVSTDQTAGSVKVWNNIIYSEGSITSGSVGISTYAGNFNHNGYLYNNTVYGFSTGMTRYGGNAAVIKNNLLNGNTTDYASSYDAASTNNISEDATSPNSSLRNLAVSFVNEGSYDFHLNSSDTAAKDAGADLSADANLAFSTDIDGETRSGTWDIGADEYVAAGGAVIPIFMNQYRQRMA